MTREEERLRGAIPVEKVKPYLERRLAAIKGMHPDCYPVDRLSQWTGVSEHTIHKILKAERPTVQLDTCDKLFLDSPYNLSEIEGA